MIDCRVQLEEIERRRNRACIVLALPRLRMDVIPQLYDVLRSLDDLSRVDVLIYCRGGQPIVARRLAKMLCRFIGHVSFIVPDLCQSAATLLVLSGREILAGPAATFTPIDPILEAHEPDASSPTTIAAEDVRRLKEAAANWFDMKDEDVGREAFSALTQQIFPTTISSFYRSIEEVWAIGREMLSLSGLVDSKHDAILHKLVHGYHSHEFPLTGDDIELMGLPVIDSTMVEAPSWEVATLIRQSLDQSRQGKSAPFCDAAVISNHLSKYRVLGEGASALTWERAFS